MMDIMKAASDTRDCIVTSEYPSERDPEGITLNHAVWMLSGICLGYVQCEKAHRWLGYAQGLLVVHQQLTLEQVKGINGGSWKEGQD